METHASIAAEFYYQCQNIGLEPEAAYDRTRRLAYGVRGSKADIADHPNAGRYPLIIFDFPDSSTLYLTRYGATHLRRPVPQPTDNTIAARLSEIYYSRRDQGISSLAACYHTRAAAVDAGGKIIMAAGDCEVFAFADGSELYLSLRAAVYAPRRDNQQDRQETAEMKTQAIMLPNHGGEDQQVATLHHDDNGGVIVESPNATRHHSMAHALEHIRARWPWAYLADPVRDDTPPPPGKGPHLGDLIAAVNRCNRNGLHTMLSYDARTGHMHIIPAHSSGRFEIDTNNCTADEITSAVTWLNQEYHRHTNPNP